MNFFAHPKRCLKVRQFKLDQNVKFHFLHDYDGKISYKFHIIPKRFSTIKGQLKVIDQCLDVLYQNLFFGAKT